jgi:hypothetical protein
VVPHHRDDPPRHKQGATQEPQHFRATVGRRRECERKWGQRKRQLTSFKGPSLV